MSGAVIPTAAPARDPVEKVDGDAEVEVALGKYEDQKLASQEIDQFFVWPEGSRPDIVHDSFDFDLPIIDLSPVLKLQTLQKELEEQQSNGQANAASGIQEHIKTCLAAKTNLEKEIRAACEEYGFFQIINHGFPVSVVEQLMQSCKQFFNMPLEVKTKVAQDLSAGTKKDTGRPTENPRSRLFGYNPIKRYGLTKTNHSHLWNEGLELELPEVVYPGVTEKMASTLWPEEPQIGYQWRSTTEAYGEQASTLSLLLLDLMAGSLGLPEQSLEEFLGFHPKSQALARLRVNHFPVCGQPELTWGVYAHTDPCAITLLHQDDVGGLQIKFKDGTWHGVRPITGAFVVNVADFVQAWTNGRFITGKHRVVVNKKTDRYSIAYFVHCEKDNIIRPRPELVDAEHPLRYRPFSKTEYMKFIYSGGLNNANNQHVLDRAFATEI